jgi:hypothetical protein
LLTKHLSEAKNCEGWTSVFGRTVKGCKDIFCVGRHDSGTQLFDSCVPDSEWLQAWG